MYSSLREINDRLLKILSKILFHERFPISLYNSKCNDWDRNNKISPSLEKRKLTWNFPFEIRGGKPRREIQKTFDLDSVDPSVS